MLLNIAFRPWSAVDRCSHAVEIIHKPFLDICPRGNGAEWGLARLIR